MSKLIVCPECGGMYGKDRSPCALCGHEGEIPDRRKPTAADRAVERIKDLATTPAVHMDSFGPGAKSMAAWFLDIIREEAEHA